MQHGTITQVEYQGAEFAIGGMEFVEIEDKIAAIENAFGVPDAEKEAAIEWVTYNVLFNAGHFVSKPKVAEPNLSKVFTGEQSSDMPNDNIASPIQPSAREPAWTQSRILAEREKLITRRETLFKQEKVSAANKHQEELEEYYYQRLKQSKQKLRFDPKFYNPDGTEWSLVDWFKFLVVALVLGSFLFAIAFVN